MSDVGLEKDDVLDAVLDVLAAVLNQERSTLREHGPQASLVDDMGLDSLTFVDLTVALEERFGLPEFPMQQWADEEKARRERYTLGSLVTMIRWMLSPEAHETASA